MRQYDIMLKRQDYTPLPIDLQKQIEDCTSK